MRLEIGDRWLLVWLFLILLCASSQDSDSWQRKANRTRSVSRSVAFARLAVAN